VAATQTRNVWRDCPAQTGSFSGYPYEAGIALNLTFETSHGLSVVCLEGSSRRLLSITLSVVCIAIGNGEV